MLPEINIKLQACHQKIPKHVNSNFQKLTFWQKIFIIHKKIFFAKSKEGTCMINTYHKFSLWQSVA